MCMMAEAVVYERQDEELAAGYEEVLKLLEVINIDLKASNEIAVNCDERLALFLVALHIQRGGKSANRLLGDVAARQLVVDRPSGMDMSDIHICFLYSSSIPLD